MIVIPVGQKPDGPENEMIDLLRGERGVLLVNLKVPAAQSKPIEVDGIWLAPEGLVTIKAQGTDLAGTLEARRNGTWTFDGRAADFYGGPNPYAQTRKGAQQLMTCLAEKGIESELARIQSVCFITSRHHLTIDSGGADLGDVKVAGRAGLVRIARSLLTTALSLDFVAEFLAAVPLSGITIPNRGELADEGFSEIGRSATGGPRALDQVGAVAELSPGPVTFLSTGVEASTRQLQKPGDAQYQAVVERSHVVLQRALVAHGGREVATDGASFLVAFAGAVEAVETALHTQLELMAEGEEPRVRMGIHTGQALLTAGSYSGLAVHQAARIRAAARVGQVFLSAETAQLCKDKLPVDVTLENLGEHRLRDLVRPQRLFRLRHPGLAPGVQSPRSLDVVRHNLPVQTSSFVGRHQELAEVAALLADERLVSLLGPGGTGKTRLAYQVAAESVEYSTGGIWVTELAPVTEEAAVPSAVLASMGLREEPGVVATKTVVSYLRGRQALVILDNCEHLVGAAAEMAQTLLGHCPQVRILATSREGLRIPGEAVYQVPGLTLPSADSPDYLEEINNTDAVRLFVTRAADVRSGFGLTAGNAADIATICARLDGLPLAIELAASRVRALSPAQINGRLSTRLNLLTKGARGAQDRQANLRGTIDWSHRLLGQAEQVLFRRLAVFAGGWEIEAAEQVCSGDGLDPAHVLDTLDSLIEKSLVAITEDERGNIRYRLLETIGAYARERLTEASEALALADRHSAWCKSLAAAASASAQGSLTEADSFDRLQAEHPNLLAALGHLCLREDAAVLEIAARLCNFWLTRGHERIAHEQLQAALATVHGTSPARARAIRGLGQVAFNRGDYPTARARFQEALTMSFDVGDRHIEGSCVGSLGDVAFYLGDFAAARAGLEQALAIARELGNRYDEARWVGSLGKVAASLGEYLEAQGKFEEALAISRDVGDRRSEGNYVGNLGNLSISLGQLPEARARLEEALAIARDLGDRHNAGRWIANLGNLDSRQGQYPEAQARYREALAIARDLGDRRSEGTRGGNLGTIALRLGDHHEAQARHQEALAIARDLGDRQVEGTWLSELGFEAILRGSYLEARERLEEALALAQEIHAQDVSLATLDAIAVLLGRLGRHPEAVELIAWTDQTRQRSGAVREAVEQQAAEQTVLAAADSIGNTALQHAVRRGAARPGAETFDVAAAWLAEISGQLVS